MSLFAFSFLGADCRPSGPQSAGAVMIVGPVVFLGGLVALFILHWLWKPLIGPKPFHPKSQARTFGALVGLSLIGYFAIPTASEWAGVALFMFGTSYLSVLLLVWRIWLLKKRDTAFSRAPIATMIGMLVPVPILLLVPLPPEIVEPLTIPWVLPGGLGYVTFPLFTVAVCEAIAWRIFPKDTSRNDSNGAAGS